MNRLVLIDANSLLHRAYHALPPLTTSQGEQVGAVFGFTSMFLKVLDELKPSYIAVAWDTAKPTFRHQKYTAYKEHRPEMPQDLLVQEGRVKEMLEVFNIPQFAVEGYEADDIIGTLAVQAGEKTEDGELLETIIVTGDLDALQLVNDQTKVFTSRRGFSDTILYGPDEVEKRYGLKPDQIVDYKALRGDPSDNIPGVRGIGEKTATKLLQQYDNLSAIYQHLNELSAKEAKLLREGEEGAFLSQDLARIRLDVPIKLELEKCRVSEYDWEKVLKLFQELEFRSLVGRLPASGGEKWEVGSGKWGSEVRSEMDEKEVKDQASISKNQEISLQNPRNLTSHLSPQSNYRLVQSESGWEELKKEIEPAQIIALDTETTSVDALSAEMVGMSIAIGPGKAWFMPRQKSEVRNQKSDDEVRGQKSEEIQHQTSNFRFPIPISDFRHLISDRKIVAHNLKYDAHILTRHGIPINLQDSFDTMLAAHLLQESQGRVGLKELAFNRLGKVISTLEEVGLKSTTRGQMNWSAIPLETLANYACTDADVTFQLYQVFKKELDLPKNEKLARLFYEVEMPLLPVILQMEKSGILVDLGYLSDLSNLAAQEVARCEQAVYKAVGHEFNLNSPKQLEEILFDELRLPAVKKTKTQRSTDESVLVKLKGLHPMVPALLKYREVFKIKSTYLNTLLSQVDANGRVHTQFNQARTATGRLSSENPNLQNIPVESEINVRKVFVAPPGHKLLVADYSQIELRVMAHFSGDERLIESFEHNQDIHAVTAARIFNKFIDEVTPAERRAAKTINFGIMYGLSAHGLSETLQIEHIKAQEYIDNYFENYPKVRLWIEDNLNRVREQGFAESLLGRRRAISEIKSGNWQARAAGERMATNMPIQATAADLIKTAMVRIGESVRPRFSVLCPQLILQVHDELVFEVPEDQIREVGEWVKKEMEEALQLKVPVKVDLKIGDNWGELEKLKE